MLTVGVLNQKGGVGKTTTVLGLASAAAAAGQRVLVLDMDPQGNASSALGLTGDGRTMNEVLFSDAKGCAAESVWVSEWPHVDAIPAAQDLSARDADTNLGSELRLRKALDTDLLRDNYDICLIDCPPSVGRLVSNALIAADAVLIVTEPAIMASQGVARVLETIATVRDNYNAGLRVAGIAVNKVPANSREARFRLAEVREMLGDQVWEPVMPMRAALVEAAGNGVPIHDHLPRAKECIEVYDAWLARLLEMAEQGLIGPGPAKGEGSGRG